MCAAVRNDTGVWFVFLPVAPLRSAAPVIPVLAAITIALGLLSSVLLCHLLCFHIYLSKEQHTCLSVHLSLKALPYFLSVCEASDPFFYNQHSLLLQPSATGTACKHDQGPSEGVKTLASQGGGVCTRRT